MISLPIQCGEFMSQPSRESKLKYSRSDKAKALRKNHYESKKAYYQEYERNRQYLKMYSITIADYDRMLKSQNGVCKMCGADRAGPKRQKFAVDHCHKTGVVRGLLCVACNVAVGFYEKRGDYVRKYLEGIRRESEVECLEEHC
jgi:hypothetical protein